MSRLQHVLDLEGYHDFVVHSDQQPSCADRELAPMPGDADMRVWEQTALAPLSQAVVGLLLQPCLRPRSQQNMPHS